MYGMTAAHKTLPLPTYAKVTNLRNGRHVILKINDRGPFHDNRLIDLSYTAASQLGIVAKGTGLVEVEAINPARWQESKTQVASKTTPIKTTPIKTTPIKTTPIKITPPKYSAQIFIQVGAFSSPYNAHSLVKKLQPYSRNKIFISNSIVNGKSFSRVRIGPLISVEQADRIAESLVDNGHDETRIVVE